MHNQNSDEESHTTDSLDSFSKFSPSERHVHFTNSPPAQISPDILKSYSSPGYKWFWVRKTNADHVHEASSSSESTPLLNSSRQVVNDATDNGFGSDEELSTFPSLNSIDGTSNFISFTTVSGWLSVYQLKDLHHDIIAGITVAFLLIPQALSYAQVLVKIPPVYGLYTCMIPLFVYSLLGTSRQLAVGPEALVSILVGATIHEYHGSVPSTSDSSGPAGGHIAEKIATVNLLALLVGLFTSALGFFRLGFLDSVLSRALLRGFVTAVVVVVAIDMLPALVGISQYVELYDDPSPEPEPKPEGSPVEKLISIIEHISKFHPLTTIISITSITFLMSIRYIKSKYRIPKIFLMIPEILVLVAASTLLCSVFRWDLDGVEVLKDVKGGFISPKFPKLNLNKIKSILLSAILISVLGFVESIAVAKTYASKNNHSVSPNRELVALGMSNVLGSIFGSWPAFGSLGRSAVNDSAGAKTQLSGFITGIAIVFTILFFLPYFYFLPKAVCSSIIVVAAFKLVEFEEVHFILQLRAWGDLGQLLMTFLTTLLISIEAGTLISVGMSLLLVIKHTTKTPIVVLGRTLVVDPVTQQVKYKFRSINDFDHVERVMGCLVIRIEEGLFFGNTGQLKDRLKRIEIHGELGVHPGEIAQDVQLSENEEEGGIKGVIFDFQGVSSIDASATLTLLEIVESYKTRGVDVCFVKLRDSVKSQFIRSGLFELVGSDHFFPKISHALEFLKVDVRNQTPFSHLTNESSNSIGSSPSLHRYNSLPSRVGNSSSPPLRLESQLRIFARGGRVEQGSDEGEVMEIFSDEESGATNNKKK
ncbi:Solute carrier 26 [Nowakowskiella sp. JEL0407]|nr:Solute carrier 26 [Nowakowskiella sp. JEL0407]